MTLVSVGETLVSCLMISAHVEPYPTGPSPAQLFRPSSCLSMSENRLSDWTYVAKILHRLCLRLSYSGCQIVSKVTADMVYGENESIDLDRGMADYRAERKLTPL